MILMRILIAYWNFSFAIQMVVILALMLRKKEKQAHFLWRVLGCLVVLGLASYFIQPGRWGLPSNDFFTVFNPFLRFTIIFAVCVASIKICYKIDLLNAIFCGISAYAIQHICYSGSNIFREILLNITTQFVLVQYLGELFYFILLTGIYFLAIKKISDRNVFVANNTHVVVMTVIVIVTTILIHNIEDILHYNSELTINAVKIVFCIYRILMCSLIVSIQRGLLDRFILKNENDTLRNIQKMEKEKYELSKECINFINIKYHDLKHITASINSGELDSKYVKDVNKSLDDYDLCVNSGNEILDVVLFEKLMHCRKNEIKLIYAVDGALLSFMDEMDIYSFFGNILDNAIESVSGLNVEERIIEFTIGQRGTFITVSSANNCGGAVKFSNGLPVTSKADKHNHGFGVKSMKLIIDKYEGDISFGQENGIFSVNAYFQTQANS